MAARTEQFHKGFYNKICHSFLHVEQLQETRNSSENTTQFLIFIFQLQFMLKSQQKVDIKLSKYVKTIKNLASDKRSLHASLKLFTNLHLNTENVGLVSSYLSTSWILLNKGQPATEC